MNASRPEAEADVPDRRGRSVRLPLAGALAGGLFGLTAGLLLSRALALGERLQQLNVTNTGSTTIRAVLDAERLGGDREVIIEPGKEGMFVYGEGDRLTLQREPPSRDGPGHTVVLRRRPIRAEANADGDLAVTYRSE